MSSDSRIARLKRISLGAKVAGAFEKGIDDHEGAGGGGSTARSSTYSSRGLYTMPHDYDSDPESKYAGQQTKGRFGPGVGGGIAARYTDEVDEGMVAVEGRGTGLHSAPPPGPNAAYIGGGKYVDTSMEASVIAGEGSIRPNSAKGSKLYSELPNSEIKRPIALKRPAMKFGETELNRPEYAMDSSRVPKPSFLNKDPVPPWRGPGSWGVHSGGYPPSAAASMLYLDRLGANPSAYRPGMGVTRDRTGRPLSYGDFGYYGVGSDPNFDDGLSFGAFWNLNPRNVDEFASQMDNMFRNIGTGVDRTNDHIHTKINRADLRFDEVESDSRAAMYDNSILPPYSPLTPINHYHLRAPKAEVPYVKVPLRPTSVTNRFNVYAR